MYNIEDLLLETKLTTDFTFGFELEALGYGEQNYRTDHGVLKRYIEQCMGKEGNFHSDGSVKEYDDYALNYLPEQDCYYNYGEHLCYSKSEAQDFLSREETYIVTPFEYASPVLKFNVANIQKVINFLKNGIKNEIFYTNETCGFHHHLSFNGITGEDAAWLVSNLALDDSARKMFSNFDSGDTTYNFVSEWSDDGYLDNLKYAINDSDFNRIKECLNTKKYSLVNVHNNNTLEWRGPRDFLNTKNKNVVIDFYKQLWKIVQWMTKTLDKTEINGMDKESFLKGLIINKDRDVLQGRFSKFTVDSNGLLSEEKLSEFFDMISDNDFRPLLWLASSSKRCLDQLIQKLFNKSKLRNVMTSLADKYPSYPAIINDIAYKYIPAVMWQLVSSDAKYRTTAKTLERLVSTRYGVNNDEDLMTRINTLIPEMNWKSLGPKCDNELLTKLCKKTNYNAINYVLNYINVETQRAIFKNMVTEIKNGNENINSDLLETFIENCDSNLKIEAKQYFQSLVYKVPEFIKYIDTLDNYMLISILSHAKAKGEDNYQKVAQMLIDSGKVNHTQIAKMEEYFSKHFDDSYGEEITF